MSWYWWCMSSFLCTLNINMIWGGPNPNSAYIYAVQDLTTEAWKDLWKPSSFYCAPYLDSCVLGKDLTRFSSTCCNFTYVLRRHLFSCLIPECFMNDSHFLAIANDTEVPKFSSVEQFLNSLNYGSTLSDHLATVTSAWNSLVVIQEMYFS